MFSKVSSESDRKAGRKVKPRLYADRSDGMDMLPVSEPAALPAVFDYSDLAPDLAERQRQRAARIISIHRRTVEAAGEIGRELLAAQDEMERGTFLRWIEGELRLSKSSAYRFMDMARSFGEKLPTVGSLPLTVVHKLAERSTPEPVRAAVLKRIEAGETIQADAIVEEIREAKDEVAKQSKAEKERARRAALTEEAREEEDALKSRGEKGRLARERKIEREREKQRLERLAERQTREREATAAARILFDGLGPETAAAFCKRFWPVADAALGMLLKFAQVERARGVEALEIDKADIVVVGHTAGWGSDYWDDKDEVRQLADEIQRDGLRQPIIVEQMKAEHHGRERYRVVDGSRRFRAVTVLLQQPSILARIAPAAEPLVTPDA